MNPAAQLRVFQTLWGWTGSFNEASQCAAETDFDGLECNLDHPCLRDTSAAEVVSLIRSCDQHLILELVTGGDYIPDLFWTPQQHLEQLREQLARAQEFEPLKISLITGSDSWDSAVQHRFLESILDLIDPLPVSVSLETHRGRSLFNPWCLPSWLQRHPRLRLTADLSHWCAVSERLMTPDLPPIQAIATHVDHIHARVGHPQGPSVSHPFAPEWTDALEAHRSCWQMFLDNGNSDSCQPFTITPEFGMDGYMPLQPFNGEPLADVQALNVGMGSWLRSSLACPAAS